MIFLPHQYQLEAIKFLEANPRAALFADPGLGKTGIMLTLMTRLYWTKDSLCPALVIAPKRVAQMVWTTEVEKFRESFGYLRCVVLHGRDKERLLDTDADIYLLNVENIFWALGRRQFRALIIDESSRFKNPKAKRFRALKKILDKFDRRYILTGTPAPQSIMDLWCQQYLVDQGAALGRYITHYRNRYFNAVTYRKFSEWTPKNGADRVVNAKVAPTTFRLDGVDHLDLPEIIYNIVRVNLPDKAYRIYQRLEKDFFAKIDSAEVLVMSSSDLYNKCCQAANGKLYFEDIVLDLHSAKIEAVAEVVGELQGKSVLIAYHYKHDLYQLFDHFGLDTPCIQGDVDIVEIAHRWNNGEIPVLLGHPLSMGHGLNLQGGGHDIIWMAPPDNLESYLQYNRRIWRQGVTGQVRVHIIVANNTIDEAKWARLNKKDQTQRAFLEALRDYRKTK